MIFASFEFVFFFGLVWLVSFCLPRARAEKWFLLLASLGFYITWSVPCVLLVIFTSLVDFSIARKISQTSDQGLRKRLLITSLVLSLGLLAFFKYTNFFLENVHALLGAVGWKTEPWRLNIVLPPGISFYTFGSIAYVLDVYYERIPVCDNARDYTIFNSFFPKLLSGPITRGSEFLPQLKDRLRASAEDVEIGLSYILIGAVKKMVVADQIAPHVNLIFASPTQFDSLTLIMGLFGYTVQLYCDFSGYSDMAIGCARILGFRLPENFQMPLSATSITDFWRRWHMTLSKWFRDYLFLPLEMATRSNPNPNLRVSINIMLMMLLVGLWHGPSWNYVIFGGIHGAALVIHKLWTVWDPLKAVKKNQVVRIASTVAAHLLTIGIVLFAFAFFRTATVGDALSYLKHLFVGNPGGTKLDSPYIFMAVGSVFLVHLLVRKDRNLALELPQMSLPKRIVGYSVLVLLLVLLGATDASPFIYFQF